MKNVLIALVLAFSFIAAPLVSEGQNIGDVLGQRINTITTAVPFLMIAPDTRSGGMGDVGVSTSPDANSMHWNPAKYAFVDKNIGVSINYTPWLRKLINDIDLGYLSAFYKLDDKQTLAMSLKYFSLGQVNFTDEIGEPIFTARPNEFSIDFAYARKLGEHFSGAIASRFIYSNLTQGQFVGGLETKPGVAVAADVSVFYTKQLDTRTPTTISVGANVSNIGNKISYSKELKSSFIPINLRLGPTVSFDLDDYNKLSFSLDINKLLVPTPPIYLRNQNGQFVRDENGELVIDKGRDPNRSVVAGIFQSFFDAPGGFSEEFNELTFSVGAEYWYSKQFAVRGGYFHEHATKGDRKFFSLGVGLKYNVFGLDFAYLVPLNQNSPLANVLRFSLHFDMASLW